MSPTICRACGETIRNPSPSKHICDACVGLGSEGHYIAPDRPDTHLTHKLWRLRDTEHECKCGLIAFWGIVACSIAIILYWLSKQLL